MTDSAQSLPDRRAHVEACTGDLQTAIKRMSGQLPDPQGCTEVAILMLCDLKALLEPKEYARACELMALGLRGISLEWTLHQQQGGRTVTDSVEDSAIGTDSPPTAH